jgi:hypothetical protein
MQVAVLRRGHAIRRVTLALKQTIRSITLRLSPLYFGSPQGAPMTSRLVRMSAAGYLALSSDADV